MTANTERNEDRVPWLSVVMPIYNGSRYLRQALDSIVAQGDPDIEVVAVDDGSDDGSLEIVESYRDRLQLQVRVSGHTGNWVANTNRGLNSARGRHACILHQDDSWTPGRLDFVRGLLRQRPELVLVTGPAWFISPHGRRLGLWKPPLVPGWYSPSEFVCDLLIQNWIPIPSPTFSVRHFVDAGGMDESLWYTADWDLWLKLGSRGNVQVVDRPLGCFRVHRDSQTWRGASVGAELADQQQTVLQRFSARLGTGAGAADVLAAARLSISVNRALADLLALRPWPAVRALALGLRSSPASIKRFVRTSGVWTRARARVLVLLGM